MLGTETYSDYCFAAIEDPDSMEIEMYVELCTELDESNDHIVIGAGESNTVLTQFRYITMVD